MSGANGQFNPNSGFENSTSGMFGQATTASPTGAHAPSTREKTASPADTQKLRGYVRKGGIVGLVFTVWASAESLVFTAPVWGMDAALFEIVMIAVLTGIPAILMFMRQGLISSASVTFLIFLSLIGVIQAVANGDPLFTGGAIIVNFIFVALTARATYAAYRLRKLQ